MAQNLIDYLQDASPSLCATQLAQVLRPYWLHALPGQDHTFPTVHDAHLGHLGAVANVAERTVSMSLDPPPSSTPPAHHVAILTIAVGDIAGTHPDDLGLIARRCAEASAHTDPRDLLILTTIPGWIQDFLAVDHLLRIVTGANALRFLVRTYERIRPDLGPVPPGDGRESIRDALLKGAMMADPHIFAPVALDQDIRRVDDFREPRRLKGLIAAARQSATGPKAYADSRLTAFKSVAAALGSVANTPDKGMLAYAELSLAIRELEANVALALLDRLPGRLEEALARSGNAELECHPAYACRERPREFLLAIEEALGRPLDDTELQQFAATVESRPELVRDGWKEPATRRIATPRPKAN